jgi:hypothetical protein
MSFRMGKSHINIQIPMRVSNPIPIPNKSTLNKSIQKYADTQNTDIITPPEYIIGDEIVTFDLETGIWRVKKYSSHC